MTITSIGYGGVINEGKWTTVAPNLGVTYKVESPADWRVSNVPAGGLTTKVAPGFGTGHGVTDFNSADVPLVHDTQTSGTRYDMVVCHRDATGLGGTTTFKIIKGTTNQLATFALRETLAGTAQVRDDQPLALVPIIGNGSGGQLGDPIDLRVWQANGGAVAVSELVLQYLTDLGTQIMIGTDLWMRTFEADIAVWKKIPLLSPINLFGAGNAIDPAGFPSPALGAFKIQAGSAVQSSDGAGFARITFPQPFPNGLLTVLVCNGDSSIDRAIGDVLTMSVAGAPWGVGRKLDFVYSVMRPRASVPTLLTTVVHRVNWFAIGW